MATAGRWRAASAERIRRRLAPLDRLVVAAVVVAVTPILVAPIRALARGWVAIGDNGLLLLRTHDVGTADTPLLGTWTSASLTAGRSINNPGPLWFDALAPFVRLLGPSVGFALGVAVVNALAVAFAAWAGGRAAGRAGALVVTALSAGLAWSMGSELLFDAWQPHAMLLPTWALLVGLWALATGDLAVAPWLAGIGSLVVQTHLSFVYLIAVTGLVAAVLAVLAVRRSPDPVAWRRPAITAAVVAAVAWAQPVLDQLFGEGNLGNLLRSGGGDSERIGLRLGTRLIGSIVAVPPWWTRPGFSGTIVSTGVIDTGNGLDVAEGDVASLPAALVGLAVVAAVLGGVLVLARRRGDRTVVALVALAAAALAACLASMVLSPVNVIGLSPHQVRWLWPVALVVWAVPLVATARWWVPARATGAVAVAATAVFALLALPTYAAPEGPTSDRAYQPTVAALVDQLGGYDPGVPVVFDWSGIRFAEPYSGPVIAALARHGVDVRFEDDGMVHQTGSGRRATGTETRRLLLREGAAVEDPPAGAVVVARVDGLDAEGTETLVRVRDELATVLERDGLRLTEDGRAARRAGRIDHPDVLLAPGDDAGALVDGAALWPLFADGYAEVPVGAEELVDRYVELSRRDATYTVALFEAPR